MKCCGCGIRLKDPQFNNLPVPKDWELSCGKCIQIRGGRRIQRSCSVCGDTIPVIGVSGSVRLVCGQCSKKKGTASLEALEAQTREVTKLKNQYGVQMEKLQEEFLQAQADLGTKHTKLVDMTKHLLEAEEALAEAQIDKEEYEKLKYKEANREETDLAARLQAKVALQYGVEAREVLQDFKEWCSQNDYYWAEHNSSQVTNEMDGMIDQFLRTRSE